MLEKEKRKDGPRWATHIERLGGTPTAGRRARPRLAFKRGGFRWRHAEIVQETNSALSMWKNAVIRPLGVCRPNSLSLSPK